MVFKSTAAQPHAMWSNFVGQQMQSLGRCWRLTGLLRWEVTAAEYAGMQGQSQAPVDQEPKEKESGSQVGFGDHHGLSGTRTVPEAKWGLRH